MFFGLPLHVGVSRRGQFYQPDEQEQDQSHCGEKDSNSHQKKQADSCRIEVCHFFSAIPSGLFIDSPFHFLNAIMIERKVMPLFLASLVGKTHLNPRQTVFDFVNSQRFIAGEYTFVNPKGIFVDVISGLEEFGGQCDQENFVTDF